MALWLAFSALLAATSPASPASTAPGTAATPAQASAVPPRKVFVAPLEARAGVPAKQLAAITDVLVAQARRVPGVTVISQADIEQMLSMELKHQLLGCSEPSCMADIGGALKVDEVLFGSVGRLGRVDLVLSLTRLNPKNGASLGGEAERLSGAEMEAILDRVPVLLQRLYPGYEPPPARVQPMAAWKLLPLVTAIGGAFQYGLFASFALSVFALNGVPILGVVAPLVTCGLCAAGPLGVSWAQAWLLDLIGRRQVGIRIPALVGAGVFAGGGLLAALWAPLVGLLTAGASLLLVATVLAPVVITLLTTGMLVPPDPSSIFSMGSGIGGLAYMGLTIAGLPLILLFAVAMPLAQAVALYKLSDVRPADAEAQLPGLWSPQEDVPGWVPSFLPDALVGGRRNAPILEEPAAAAPAATPVPAR